MKRLRSGIARPIGAALFILLASGRPAAAVDVRASTLNARQVRSCMVKRMMADRTLSYNAAKRNCAEQLKAQSNPIAAPLPLAASREGGTDRARLVDVAAQPAR